MNEPSIYLAGPWVFFPNWEEIALHLKLVCEQHGAVGLFPTDAVIAPHLQGKAKAKAIFSANVETIHRSHGIVANLSPFRGPSADSGTVWETAYGYALGKPIAGFTTDSRTYREKLGNSSTDPDGFAIEDFGLADNLMIRGGLGNANKTLGEMHPDFETALVGVLLLIQQTRKLRH